MIILIAQISFGQNLDLSRLVNNHMVLQQNASAPLWGWSEPGTMVRVSPSWNGEVEYGHTDIHGKWMVKVNTPSAGGPYSIFINQDTIQDVLIGEVWVASGQSNMQWALQQSENFEEELLKAADSDLRFFYVARENADEPKRNIYGKWDISDSISARTFSAVAYYFGKKLRKELDIPIGIIHDSWGGSSVQAWINPEVLGASEAGQYYEEKFELAIQNAKPGAIPRNHTTPSGLYNGMLKPIIPYAIAGVIWYQGESNRDRPDYYGPLFNDLVESWRNEWNQGEFPFYFVQLAPYRYNEVDMGSYVRDVQRRCLAIPNTGMAVTLDIGNVENIHPTNKLDVGNRLALWALAKTYGQKDLVYSGPLYQDIQIEDNRAVLSFTSIGSGLMAKGKLETFEIAGADQVFYPAKAKIVGDKIEVKSSKVKAPVAVRYAFRNTDEATLFNKEGLPAPSFRTDDWVIPIN